MRQELQALRQVALRSAEAEPSLGAAVPGAAGDRQLQGHMRQLPGGQAVGPGSAARQQPQSLVQQQASGQAAAGHSVAGQQPEQPGDPHLHQTQASGTEQLPHAAAARAAEHAGYCGAGKQLEQAQDVQIHLGQASGPVRLPQRAAAHAAEHAEASRRAQPAEPLLQPQASSRGGGQTPHAPPQEAQDRHQELLEAQRQVLAGLERALQPSARQAALHGAPSHAQVEPDLPAVAPQASTPGSHGAGSVAAGAPAIDESRLGHSGHGSTFATGNALRVPPRGSHEEAAHVMQQLQQSEDWRHPQQHQGLPLSREGAADADEGQQKRGEPGQPLQQAGRGSNGLAGATCGEAAAAEERALSLSQWQKGPQGGDQQGTPEPAEQPGESARHVQDQGVAGVQHQWAAAQPAAALAVPRAAGVLQQVQDCDQPADHRHVEPAGEPAGGLEQAQHPGVAGESRPQHGLPPVRQADPQQRSRPCAEQRRQPAELPEASEVTEAEHGQQLRRSDAPQQQTRIQGVPDSPQPGRAPEGRQRPNHSPSARETAAVRGHAPAEGHQQTHGLPDMDVTEAPQPGKGMAAQGQQDQHDSPRMEERHDSPRMDAADALQLRQGLSSEEQEVLELQRDMQELEAQMAHAAGCGACGLASWAWMAW